jgi:tetratricopeptide (TPR) repeat protein
VKYLHQVISLDPEFAEPQALLGIMLTGAAMFDGGVVFDASIPTIALQGKQFAWRAFEIDPECSEANSAVAFQEFQYGWNWKSAESYFKRALELDPNFAWAHMLYAWALLQMGFQQESRSEILVARTLDPASVFFLQWEGILRYYARDYSGAIEWLEDLVKRHPAHGWTGLFLACAYAQVRRCEDAIQAAHNFLRFSEGHHFGIVALIRAYVSAGKEAEAQHWLKVLENSMSTRTIDPYRHAVALASLGEADRAFDALDRAFRRRSGWIPHLDIDPELDSLRDDPRWKALNERISITRSRKGP